MCPRGIGLGCCLLGEGLSVVGGSWIALGLVREDIGRSSSRISATGFRRNAPKFHAKPRQTPIHSAPAPGLTPMQT
jgi:hypothetical protein